MRESYRSRFGIESSYRQINQARCRTSTRRPELRLLYAGIALVLRNEWVWLHFEVLSTPRQGRRLLRQERLRLKALLHWLLGVVELEYLPVIGMTTERPIFSELINAQRTLEFTCTTGISSQEGTERLPMKSQGAV